MEFRPDLEGRAPSRFRHILWTLLAPCVWIHTGTVHVIYHWETVQLKLAGQFHGLVFGTGTLHVPLLRSW